MAVPAKGVPVVEAIAIADVAGEAVRVADPVAVRAATVVDNLVGAAGADEGKKSTQLCSPNVFY